MTKIQRKWKALVYDDCDNNEDEFNYDNSVIIEHVVVVVK